MFKNWKTSLIGLAILINHLVPVIAPVVALPTPVTGLITSVCIAVGFFLSKDHNVTGGTVSQ